MILPRLFAVIFCMTAIVPLGRSQTGIRLKSFSRYRDQGGGLMRYDSTAYFYADDSRGSSIKAGGNLFDLFSNPAYLHPGLQIYYVNADTSLEVGGLGPWKREIQLFTIGNRLQQALTQTNGGGTGPWVNANRYDYSYSGGLLQQKMTLRWNPASASWENVRRETSSYDNNQNLLATLWEDWDTITVGWVMKQKTENTFDPQSRLIAQQFSDWDALQSLWKGTFRNLFHYDTSGDMDSSLLEQTSNGINWDPYSVRKYRYNSNHDPVIFEYWYYPFAPSWRDSTVFDNNHNRLFIFSRKNALVTTDSLVDDTRTEISYLNGQVSKWTMYYLDTTFPAFQGTYRLERNYYYEQYEPARIAQLPQLHADIAVCPIPSSDLLQLRIQWTKPEAFSVSLMNSAGQLIQTWQERPMASYARMIPIRHLPAGAYLLNIRSASGQATRQVSVVH